MKTTLARRRFLLGTGLGLLTSASWPRWLAAMEGMNKIAPLTATPGFKPDVELDLTCQPSLQSILPGAKTRVYRYHARLRKGPENTLLHLSGSYLGPILRFATGQKIRIHLHNRLDEPSITHWHGLHVPAHMDGHPRFAIDRGETFVYEFEMRNRAGMAIYHPHPHDITGWQVYQGLAGAILIHDAEERRLALPDGDYEIPLVIQDRLFNDDNQLVYTQHMHDRMMGMHGDRILVNGRPDFKLDVDSRAYRFRLLNAANARIYKLAWSDGSPITVLGTDGGLLAAPVSKPYVMLAPGERLDVWADFSGRAVGEQLELRSRPFQGALPAMAQRMMHGGMHASSLPLGGDYPLLTVNVTRKVTDSPELPQTLADAGYLDMPQIANPDHPVPIGIG
ncbi:MAG: multicopper oxidase domain-containing protein [Methylococcales bacterium]|nr:multicopper oxidase domain-containing protein [Methylococcales bacterium]